MLVGYMRVSTSGDRQVLDLQRDALLAAGVDARHLFEDRVTGSRGDRAGLTKALAFIKPGDCLVVWKLDRLGRSLPHLLTTVTDRPISRSEVSPSTEANRDFISRMSDFTSPISALIARNRLSFADRADGYDHAAR
jgi:Resolvase, N terminal domain